MALEKDILSNFDNKDIINIIVTKSILLQKMLLF
jgi:hypothetical protein